MRIWRRPWGRAGDVPDETFEAVSVVGFDAGGGVEREALGNGGEGGTSCPPLRKEAVQAVKLDEQVQVWLSDVFRNGLVWMKGRIYVSEIFQWFDDDFGGKDERVIEWIADIVKDKALGKRLRAQAKTLDVRYLDYDWSISGKKENR